MLMFRSFTAKPDFTSYQSVLSSINLEEINTAYTPLAKHSEGLGFAKVDDNMKRHQWRISSIYYSQKLL